MFVELMVFDHPPFFGEAKAMFRQFFGREPDGNVSALTLVDMSSTCMKPCNYSGGNSIHHLGCIKPFANNEMI